MGKFIILILALANISIAAVSMAPRELCGNQPDPQDGCFSENPARDLLVPGRKTILVAPIDLNHDSLVDLVVQGDGGSGGNNIYIFFQDRIGGYILKGKSFGFAIHLENKKDAAASLIVHSQTGICRQHFERLDFENEKYTLKASFLWKCQQESGSRAKYALDEMAGSWPDTRLKAGLQGERSDVLSLIPETQMGFVLVDENLKLQFKN